MKKVIIAVLVLLALVLLIMPGAVGVLAENQFRALSGNLDSEAPGLQLLIEDYERGWFSSRARYRLSLEQPVMEASLKEVLDEFPGMPALVNEAEIFHGPILFAALGREGVSLAPVLAQSFDEISIAPGDNELITLPARVITRLAIAGPHSNHISVARYQHAFDQAGGAGTLTWGGMNLRTHFNAELNHVAVEGQIDSIDISSDKFLFRAGPVTVHSQNSLTEYGLWVGDGQLTWAGMRLDASDKAAFAMGELVAEADSNIKAGKMHQGLQVSLADISINGWQGGPGKLVFSAEKLDAKALGKLVDLLRQLAWRDEKITSSAAVMPVVFPQIQALLAGGPQLAVPELSFGTADGVLSFTGELVFPESTPEAAFAFITGLTGNAQLRLPVALTDSMATLNPQAEAGLRALRNAGFLVSKGNELVLDAAVKGGLLTVNGQPIPLPMGF